MSAPDQLIKDYIARELLADRPGLRLENDTPLIQQGIVDSLGVFLLAGFIEERFDVKIEEEDVLLENFATVDRITDLVFRKRDRQRSAGLPRAGGA